MYSLFLTSVSFLCIITVDAGVFVLWSSIADCFHLWSENTWMQLDVRLDPLLCWSHGTGDYYVSAVFHISWKSQMQHKVWGYFPPASPPPLSRLSGAISEHLCTPALPSHTESQQTNGGLLSPSMFCLLLLQLCWPCAATSTLLILWNLFPRDRPRTTKRKTRPHTSHGQSRNTLRLIFSGESLLQTNLY